MQIEIKKNSKIYILTPANVATGGVELLHQLAFKIKSVLGFENVYIKYLGEKEGISPTPKDYEKYKIESITEIQDSENNILIVPEVYTGELFKYKKIIKVIWWLSVDNYYYNSVGRFARMINRMVVMGLFHSQKYLGFDRDLRKIENHRVQSEYARQHLLSKGIQKENIEYLSDYLIADFFDNKWDIRDKEDIICYNPKKGYKYTKKLIEYMGQDKIKFVPIQNMNREEVINLLKKSKLYIDLGYFPGKDRIPREASVLGNIIIISKMGSGGYQKDFPLNEEQKVQDLNDLKGLKKKILYNIDNYSNIIHQLDNYRSNIKSEEENFNKDLKNIFLEAINN